MTNRLAFATGCLSLGAVIATSSAKAQAIDTDSIIRRTCQEASSSAPNVTGDRLAYFVLADAGIQASQPAQQLRDILAGSVPIGGGPLRSIRDNVYRLQERLSANSPESASDVGLRAAPAATDNSTWWLVQPNLQLSCTKFAAARQNTGSASPGNEPFSLGQLRLRQNAEALSAADGQERLAAGAAQIGLRRERRVLDNGTTRTDNTLSVEAALGWALRDRADSALLLYGAYQRERLRSDPPPQLAPGASQADKDTNILELGVTGRQLVRMGNVNLMLRGSGSYISNYVDDSERLRLKLSATPYFGPFPRGRFCYFGGFADAINRGFGSVRGRCSLTFLAQVNHVLVAGSATIGTNDEFVLAGGRIGYELAAGEAGGVVAGVTYEYQRTIHGNVPSIDRLTAHLKYRIWTGDKSFGIEFGFDFADGINPETFNDENRIRLGVGLIF